MDSMMMRHLFQYLNRIEKKLDEALKMDQMNLDRSKAPFHLMQGLAQPGQNPCALCGKVPVYRKVSLGHDSDETIILRICECEPHTEDI